MRMEPAYNVAQYTEYTPSAVIHSRRSSMTVDRTYPTLAAAVAGTWRCKQQTDCSCCVLHSPDSLCAVAKVWS